MKLTDPIEEYTYPEEWIEKCPLSEKEIRNKISSGLFILTPDGDFLRRGLTTGTVAAGIVKAGILSISNPVNEVEVATPAGIPVKIEVKARDGLALAIKNSGDHEFDVTDGCTIEGRVTREKGIYFGQGVGRFRKRYAFYNPGTPSVSPSAMDMIRNAYIEACRETGFKGGIEISVKNGDKIAMKTSNPRLGIVGGISILGSTGFVEPWCSRLIRMKAELVRNIEKLVLATGRKGWASGKKLFPDYTAIVIGTHFDRILPYASGSVRIVSLPSLAIKWAVRKKRYRILWENPESFVKEDVYRILEKANKLTNGVVEGVYLIDYHGRVMFSYESSGSWTSSRPSN